MEKNKDSEKSQRIISFHWREEAILRRQLSSLDSMKKQVEASYCLDQRILFNRFQTKLRRSVLAQARTYCDKELIQSLGDKDFSFNTTLTDETERAIRQIVGFGQCPPSGREKHHLWSACGCSGPILSRNKKCESLHLVGSVPQRRIRSESSRPFRGAILHPTRPLTSCILPSLSRLQRPRPITATVAFQDTKHPPSEPVVTVREASEEVAVKDDQPTPKEKSSSGFANKHRQHAEKRGSQDSPVAHIPTGEEVREDEREDKPSTAGTRGHKLGTKVSQFVEKVQEMRQQQGPMLSDYYSKRLKESLSSRKKESCRVTEEDHKKWCLVGSEIANRSITILSLDTDVSQEEIPADLLLLESYSALLTRENREERNWIGNNPYGSKGPSSSA